MSDDTEKDPSDPDREDEGDSESGGGEKCISGISTLELIRLGTGIGIGPVEEVGLGVEPRVEPESKVALEIFVPG